MIKLGQLKNEYVWTKPTQNYLMGQIDRGVWAMVLGDMKWQIDQPVNRLVYIYHDYIKRNQKF